MRIKNRINLIQRLFNFNLFITFINIILLSSCSILTSKNSVSESQDDFKQILKKRNYTDTVPVEIASEFNELALKNMIQLPALAPDNQLKNPFEKSQIIDENTDEKDIGLSEITKSGKNTKRKLANENNLIKKSNTSTQNTSINKNIDKMYKIKKGDTLMKISFQEFGDIFKWRKILNDNKSLISNYNYLIPGTEIHIKGKTYIVVNHNGKPYLIQKNDTLSKISNKVYGDFKKWNLLWKNNLELIKDPNKIYQGFTLYYEDSETIEFKNKSNISKNNILKTNLKKENVTNISRKIATTKNKINNLKNTKDHPESLSTKEE